MKFQFYRLYALLVISSAFIIWSFSEIHETLRQDNESYLLDIETVFASEIEHPKSLINYLSADDLALPLHLTDRLAQGKTIAFTLSNDETYYYHQDPNNAQFIALGPIKHSKEVKLPTERIIFALYASLGCLALLLIWPLFNDLATLQQDAISFGKNHKKMPLRINKNSAIYPLAKVYNDISNEIVDFIQMHKELSRTISHEVRTPLSRMRFALQLSKEELNPKYWQRLNADIDDIEQLANHYLNFAKLEHREAMITKQRYSPIQFLSQLEEKFALYQDKITIEFISSGKHVYLDTNSMTIATQNLIMNALRFAKNHIIVNLECDEQYCKLTVQDDGPGFEGKGKQLLAAFVRDKEQADSSGYGLGLYIVRKVAIWHQGTLQINHSEKLNGASLSIEWQNKANKPQLWIT